MCEEGTGDAISFEVAGIDESAELRVEVVDGALVFHDLEEVESESYYTGTIVPNGNMYEVLLSEVSGSGTAVLSIVDDEYGTYWANRLEVEIVPCDGVGVPNPLESSMHPADAYGGIVLEPGDDPSSAGSTLVTIKDSSGNPVDDCAVSVLLSVDTMCEEAVLSGMTDENGEVELLLAGGGASDLIDVCQLFADGIRIRSFDRVRSPDHDGVEGDLSVGLSDLVTFTEEFHLLRTTRFHDYNGNGSTGLEDLTTFARAFKDAVECEED